MDKAIYNHIVKILKDYPHFEKYAKERENYLAHGWHQADENIGGGKSNVMTSQFGDYDESGNAIGKPSVTNSTEVEAITIADDRRLINMELEHDAVNRCFAESDPETKTIIQELYIRPRPILTVDGVADKVHLSASQVRRKREQFFGMMRQSLGW